MNKILKQLEEKIDKYIQMHGTIPPVVVTASFFEKNQEDIEKLERNKGYKIIVSPDELIYKNKGGIKNDY